MICYKKYSGAALCFCFILLTIVCSSAYAQQAGELIEIDYPGFIDSGEDLAAEMTVRNTGTITWHGVCAFVRYIPANGTTADTIINTCYSLGSLAPGETGTYICSSAGGISVEIEKAWAGVGAPLG